MTDKEAVRARLDRLPDDRSPEDAPSHLSVVQAAARGLADHEVGRVVPEPSDPAVRERLVHRHRVPYRIFDEVVVIAAFLHGARDPATRRRSRSEP